MKPTLIQVNPSDLKGNPWNSNVVSPANEAKLEESIRQLGMFKPIVVRELRGSYQIIGGEHRAQLAKRMGLPEIPAFNLGPIDDVTAKKIGLQDNNRFGEDDTLKLAEIFGDIGSPEDLATYMPFSMSEIDSIFSSSSVALDVLDDLNLPDEEVELPQHKAEQTHQIMRFKVPVGDVDDVTALIGKIIKTQGFDDSDSLANAGDALVHLTKHFK